MKLNPGKCKEMLINFMHEPNFLVKPITMGNNTIERVSCYKLLGVYISDNLKWNNHVDYIYKKACKRLYSLRVLYRAGIGKSSILKVYLTVVRPILD